MVGLLFLSGNRKMKELNNKNTYAKSKLFGQNLDYCIKIMRHKFLDLPSHASDLCQN